MSGIVGLIRIDDRNPTEELERMLSSIKHRGTGGSGVRLERLEERGWLGLAQRAAQEFDSKDHLPLLKPSGQYALLYDGELYNRLEILGELKGRLPTETNEANIVFAALIEWGETALERFNGKWALAFYNSIDRTLLLARDRMGEKPLYIYRDEGQLIFASEMKSILVGCGRKLNVNRVAAARFLHQSLMNAQPETLFEGIVQFPPASYSILDLRDLPPADPIYHAYWLHPFERGDPQSAEPRQTIELRQIFLDSVDLRLQGGSQTGILLSGGLDSSAIVGAAGKLGHLDAVQIFSVISDDPDSSEEPFIDLMAEFAGLSPIKMNADNNPEAMLDSLSDACWHNEAPIASFSSIAHRNLIAAAKGRGITTLITGQGADEQLAGYNKFFYFYLQDCLRRGRWREAASILIGALKERTIPRQFSLREAKRYIPLLQRRTFALPWLDMLREVELINTGLGKGCREREWRDIRQLSLPALLHYEDRMSSSHSCEMRAPFLDCRLVELLGRIPISAKLKSGWSKSVFREAVEGMVPREIQYRRDKRGFNLPEDNWIRHKLRRHFAELFDAEMLAEQQDFIDRAKAKAMFAEFLKGSRLINYKDVFNLYSFEIWLRRFEPFIAHRRSSS